MGAAPGGGAGGDGAAPDEGEAARRALEALHAADLGVWDWDVVTGELVWDERIARLHGVDPAAFDGTLASFLARVPDDEPVLTAAIRQALTSGGEFLTEFRVERPDGSTAWVQGRGRALQGVDGVPVRIIGVGADTTRLRSAREQVGRTLEHISDGVAVLDAERRLVYVNPRAARLVRRRAEDLVGGPLADAFPELAGSGFDRWVDHVWVTQRPASFEAWYEALGIWVEVRAFPAPDGLTFYLQDVTERRAAEEAQARLVALLEEALTRQKQVEEVVVALSEALTVDEVSAIVLAEAGRVLDCTYAGIALLDEDDRTLRFASLRPLPDDVAARWLVIPLDMSLPITDAVRTRQAIYHQNRAEIAGDYRDRALAGTAEGAGGHAFVNAPLIAGGHVLGALSLSWATERTFSAEERTFITTLAAQCAQAVERALLFAHQHDVADTLQQAMLPDRLPVVAGATLAACYRPATAGIAVGGDWYDALTLPDGRVMLAVGDVAGHGLGAAAVMGQLRNALRGYVIDGAGPAEALEKLDHFVELAAHGLFATVIVGLYDPATGELRFANAGHPPLLVRTSGGGRFVTGRVRPPLGLRPVAGGHELLVVLDPGDTLVAYTDGLVERRREPIDVGLGRLARAVEAAGPVPSDEWCVALVDALVGDGLRYDDVCVLALHRHDAGA